MRFSADTQVQPDTGIQMMHIKWKRQHVLVAVGLSLLLALPSATAEVLELEGTVKAVDAASRSITIVRKTPKGTKTLELEVTKKAGDLSSVEAGDSISFSYDPDLELVTKLGAGLTELAQSGEVNVLHELDTKGHENHPWVTPDSLTIYWTADASTPDAKQRDRWMARRQSPNDLFVDKEKIGFGQDGTFTADGREGIIFISQGDKSGLFMVTREDNAKPFGRPSAINSLPSTLGFVCGPSLSDDGCTLYFERGTDDGQEFWLATRKTIDAEWGEPQPLPIASSQKPRKFLHVSTSGQWLVCTEPDSENKGVLRVYQRKEPDESFQDMGAIYDSGKPLYGRYGRYIEKSSELFFAQVGDDGKFQLAVLAPFDPETADLQKK